MQAAYIGTMEAVSAAPPPKISGAASSSPAAENFGLSWQRAASTRTANAALQSKGETANASGMNAARQNDLAGNRASTASGQGRAGSVPTVEAGSAGEMERESLGTGEESAALKPLPKAVVNGKAGVEGRAESGADGSSSATLGKQSVLPKEALPGADGRPSAIVREKERKVVENPTADAAKKPAATQENKGEGTPAPQPMPHSEAAQAGGTQLAIAPGGQAKCDGRAVRDVAGKSSASAKISSMGLAGEHSAVAVNEAAASVLEHEKRSGKERTVAAPGASDSIHPAGMGGLQSASMLPQSVSTGPVSAAGQPLNPAPGSAPSLGAQLHSGVANAVEGSVAGGYTVMAVAPGRLDVGVFDGTHGWLQIRAELGTGGEVKASLTTGASAYDAVRSVVPEMVRYLQSEAVSVSQIAVHRGAETSPGMGLAQGESGQNGSTPRDGAAQTDVGVLQRGFSSANGGEEGLPSATASTAMAGPTIDRAGSGSWMDRPFGALPWIGMAGGFWGGGSGSWLNVHA